jgi:hypothetical protein
MTLPTLNLQLRLALWAICFLLGAVMASTPFWYWLDLAPWSTDLTPVVATAWMISPAMLLNHVMGLASGQGSPFQGRGLACITLFNLCAFPGICYALAHQGSLLAINGLGLTAHTLAHTTFITLLMITPASMAVWWIRSIQRSPASAQ